MKAVNLERVGDALCLPCYSILIQRPSSRRLQDSDHWILINGEQLDIIRYTDDAIAFADSIDR